MHWLILQCFLVALWFSLFLTVLFTWCINSIWLFWHCWLHCLCLGALENFFGMLVSQCTLSWNNLNSPSILKDRSSGLSWEFLYGKILQTLLGFVVYVERSAIILMDLPLYMICSFSLSACKTHVDLWDFDYEVLWSSFLVVITVFWIFLFLLLTNCSHC